MKKKILIGIVVGVVVLLIVLFVYPKECGFRQGGYVLPNPFYTKECACIGLKYKTCGGRFESVACADTNTYDYCAGIPINKKCYEVNSTGLFIYKSINCSDNNLNKG